MVLWRNVSCCLSWLNALTVFLIATTEKVPENENVVPDCICVDPHPGHSCLLVNVVGVYLLGG